jgi:lipopolysaccharide export system protein LptC
MPSPAPSTKRRRFPFGSFIVAGLAACLIAFAQAQDSGASLAAILSQNIPLGVENKNAVLPSFDPGGRRSSLMTADVVRRVDEERLYAEGFVFEQYHLDPDRNLRIDLSTAFYNLKTSTLRSTQRSKVTRKDFEIEGDSLIFETATNRSLMEGNIRMVIFDTKAKSGEETSAQPPSKP